MTDERGGGLGVDTEAGAEHTDVSAFNEFDPTQTEETEYSPSLAQDHTVQSPSFDTTMNTSFFNMQTATTANLSHQEIAASDRQSLSRSMSRASSQSDESVKITTSSHNTNNDLSNYTGELGGNRQSGDSPAQYMGTMPSLDPVSESTVNISANAVSSSNAPIQNNVQNQSPPHTALNGITNSVPNLAAVIPDTGASSHGEYTAKPSQTLPAPSITEAIPAAKVVPPTPTTPAPRARLPHDKIGILEDRIKEDPRGDLEAWLNLIDEHKKRAKFDDARSVYERFLGVFPSAVCNTFAKSQPKVYGANYTH